MQTESLNTMATGRVTKKVLDYIAEVNKQAKQMTYAKELKKEVNIEFLRKQMDKVLVDIEKLKDANREMKYTNGSSQ